MSRNEQSTPERRAQVIYLDAARLATNIAAAMRNLHTAEGGYPTGLEGNGAEPASSTERAALNPPDQATRDRAALNQALRAAENAIQQAAALAYRWGTWNVSGANTDTRERFAADDAELWCRNCGPMGHKNPRPAGRAECQFCADFPRDYKRSAPKEVLDLRATKGRIYVQDIDRILNRLKIEAGEKKTRR